MAGVTARLVGTERYAQLRSIYWKVIVGLIVRRARGRIVGGPFAGTAYAIGAVNSASVPKLLGTYERELQVEVEGLARVPWVRVIDVGAAEGYYAVGFARRVRGAEVLAYESDEHGRRLLQDNVRRNGVGRRVRILGECTRAELAARLAEPRLPTLAILDVEGAEADLLSETDPAHLARVTFLIEVHDFASCPGGALIGARLRERLERTHDLRAIASAPRHKSEFPRRFWFVPPRNRGHAMDEYRPRTMEWIVARPRFDPRT